MTAQAGTQMSETGKQWVGELVNGEFPLLQYLGSSRQGAVFLTERGRDKAKQKAAIKLVFADSVDEEVQFSRWQRAAALSHPHLIRLFEMGRCQLDGKRFFYVVMEYAEENLSQILPSRSLTPAEAREMLGPLLNTLDYLHTRGLVHGHVKPANIMAIADQLKLSSDGICSSGESPGGRDRPSAYDAPEISHAALSPAADVWSVGMTLVEVLTQSVPTQKPQADPDVPEKLPALFFEIARHCLVRDPQARYTVPQIITRLQPGTTAPKTRDSKTGNQPGKSLLGRLYWPIAGLAAIVLVAVFAGQRLLHRSPAAESPQAAQVSNHEPASPGPIASPAPVVRTATPAKPHDQLSNKGAVAQRVLPRVPQSARDTISGKVKVRVRVKVDPSGNVVGTSFDSAGPSQYFARLAKQAAENWKFTPPQANGANVPSQWVLRFEFGRNSTEVFPSEVAPQTHH